MKDFKFEKGQRVVAVDGRYDARVIRRHKDGMITIRQGFMLRNGEPVPGTYLGYISRINPALVRVPEKEARK